MIKRAFLILGLIGLFAGCQKQLFIPIAVKNAVIRPGETSTAIPTEIRIQTDPIEKTTLVPKPVSPLPTETITVLLHLPLLNKPGKPAGTNWVISPNILQGSKNGGRYILELRYPDASGELPASMKKFPGIIQEWLNLRSEEFLNLAAATSSNSENGFLISSYIIPSRPDWTPLQSGIFYSMDPGRFSAEQVILDPGSPLISILIQTSVYSGGAHPFEQHYSLNYDLEQGQVIDLSALFQPGVDYLSLIAYHSIRALHSRQELQTDQINRGAAPLLENYRVWNITPEGLLITFEEYQVGPYAAGPQHVLIPFYEIAPVLNNQGPLRDLR